MLKDLGPQGITEFGQDHGVANPTCCFMEGSPQSWIRLLRAQKTLLPLLTESLTFSCFSAHHFPCTPFNSSLPPFLEPVASRYILLALRCCFTCPWIKLDSST